MMRVRNGIAIGALMTCLAAVPARAGEGSASQPAEYDPPWPSAIWNQPGLLDGPGSPMEALRNSGIDLKAFLTQTYMGLPAGSASHAWQYGGKMTINATFDGAKLGLWQGFTANVIQEWNYGNDINTLGSGAILPMDSIMAFPRLGGYDSDTSIVLTQKFSENFSVSLGKFSLLDLVSKTPLVGGGGYETFMNAGLAGPITAIIPPYIAGAIANLTTSLATFALMVYDPRNAQDWDVVSHPFSQGTSTALTITFPTKIAGLSGFYSVRGVYSSQQGLDLARIPDLVALPPDSETTLQKKGRWFFSGSFQQYLFEDKAHPGAGWGLFGYLSVSDGNPNPLQWTSYVGVGGTSPMAGRHLDKWGIAYFHYGLSHDLLNGLSALGINRQDEQGIEVFYNLAVTPWFRLTADVQWIDPFDATKNNIVATGLRAQIRF